jgi:hypothetical protein
MTRAWPLLILLAFSAPVAWSQDLDPTVPETPTLKPIKPPAIRGMGLTMHSKDPSYDYGPMLSELPAMGVTHICVFVHFYQPNARSQAPARHPLKTPTDRAISNVLKAIRDLGMQSALLPIVLLETPRDDEWRGAISPPDRRGREKGSEGYRGPNWNPWFAGYTREIMHFARLAEEGGASLFSVGSELSTTEAQKGQWTRVVERVRKVFSGRLTYSANWDHYSEVKIWPLLDCIGVSGYYELTTVLAPTQEELDASWVKVRTRLNAWRANAGLEKKKILFTELGYPSIDGGARHPWDYTRKADPDHVEQEMAYRAFGRAWEGRDELLGVFFYEWWGLGGAGDRGYTPREKPAADVIRIFFSEKR